MKAYLVLTLAVVVLAEPPVYGVPGLSSGSGYGGGGSGNQISKHVLVDASSDYATGSQPRVIQSSGAQDTHVNLIFVKAPTPPSQRTEVILPKQDEQKTLVYVLLKKGEDNSEIKVRTPPPRIPSKPEVFFIKYSNNNGDNNGGTGGSQPSYGVPN